MKRTSLVLCALLFMSTSAYADMSVKLAGGWDGKKIPQGQQCKLFGGKGATPPMKVTGLPSGTQWIHVEFNDRDYRPLSKNGGHGVIGYPISGNSADLYSVPGLSGKLPGRAVVVSAAKSSGDYASAGYLPPCSGGKGNRYFAVVKAISSGVKILEKQRVDLGRY